MYSSSQRDFIRRWVFHCSLALLCVVVLIGPPELLAAGPPPAHSKEHAITIDPTPLVPQSWWQVPGVTPPLWVLDPETSDAYRTTETRELKLKPGNTSSSVLHSTFPLRSVWTDDWNIPSHSINVWRAAGLRPWWYGASAPILMAVNVMPITVIVR